MPADSRTLTLGAGAGSRVIFEAAAGDADVARAANLARDAGTVWSAGKGGKEWIVGRGEHGVLRLVRGEDRCGEVSEALRCIEQSCLREARGVEAIFAALLAAGEAAKEGLDGVQGAPALFAQVAEQWEPNADGAWSDAALEDRVRECMSELAGSGTVRRAPGGPLESARFWLRMGAQLWDPDVRAQLGAVRLDGETRRLLMLLAGAWMGLRSEGKVRVRGSVFRLRGAARRLAWPQVMEWEAGGVSEGALEYLTAYQRSFAFDGILVSLLGLGSSLEELVPSLVAANESRSLLEEAALKWTCDPFGSFRVDVPVRTPLARWGVTSLRVWIVPHEGLWVGLEKNDEPGASLQWTVRAPHLRRWVLEDKAVPAMHLTLSALWRDLKVGGREVLLAERKARDAQKGEVGLHLYGRIRWGSKAELAGILRQAYPVEEHVRVLPKGMRATRWAFRRAMAEGIALRPGTTFVRRHHRGKPEQTAENVPWKAQGLARLILASRSGADLQCGVRGR